MSKMLARNATVGCVQRQRTSQPLVAGEILRKGQAQRSGREERIAQRGQRAGDADNHHHEDAGDGAEGRDQADAAAQVALACG